MSDGIYGNASLLVVSFGTMAVGAEAWTEILAVWVARGPQAALAGIGAGGATLGCVFVLLNSENESLLPSDLEMILGSLLVIFGMRWQRKAILRYAGAIAKRDEATVFQQMRQVLKQPKETLSVGLDWYGALVAFRSTLLNGLRVVFIILALGITGDALSDAGLGLILGIVLTIIPGLLVRRPLIEVPGNRLKFSVGAVLCAFGVFWVGKGFGLLWPDSHLTVLVLAMGFWAVGWMAVIRRSANPNYSTIIPFKPHIP
mgnify:CR=1 FL=1